MNAAKHGGKSDRMTNISPDGDVILIVGEEEVRLRVQSQCLRSASKPFGIMFGSVWREGQSLSKELPTEVPLGEDNADAMWTICCILHHHNDLVPPYLTAEEIFQVALAVNKYDLKIALTFASVEWLKPRVNATRVDMGLLLAATFLFNDAEAFIAHTTALILHYNGSYVDFLDDEFLSQIVPLRTFHLLEERRTKFRAELCQLLIAGKRESCGNCGWGKCRSEKYRQFLVGHWPIQMLQVSITEIITTMVQVSTKDAERKFCGLVQNGSNFHKALFHNETLTKRLDTLKKTASICIDCVRSIGGRDSVTFTHE